MRTCTHTQALCLACGSDPEKGTQKKIGSFLMLTCFQTTTVSSSMFITGESESTPGHCSQQMSHGGWLVTLSCLS